MMDSVIVRLEKAAILRVIQQESAFSAMFIAHLLNRAIRTEADLVDQLFNSSEKRLRSLRRKLVPSIEKKASSGCRCERMDRMRSSFSL